MCTDVEEPKPQKMLLYSENSVTVYRDKNSHPEDHRVMPTHTFTHIQQTRNKSTLVPRSKLGCLMLNVSFSFRNPHSRIPIHTG